METKDRISPFQLISLLLVCRLFTVVIWSPNQPEAGSLLLAIGLSPLVQLPVALLLRRLFERLDGSNSRKWLRKGLLAVCWLAAMAVAALTAAMAAEFLSGGFYHDRYGMVMAVLLAAAAICGVLMGLEAFARAAPAMVLLAGLGLLALVVGSADTMHLSYLPFPAITAGGTVRLVLMSLGMSFELLLFALLQPSATKRVKVGAVWWWLVIIGAVSMTLTLTIMLSMGAYAGGQQFPVYGLARVSSLPVMERMDSLLMGLWVMLGFFRTTVCLYTANLLWGRVFTADGGKARTMVHGGAVCLAAVLLLSGCTSHQVGTAGRSIVTMLELEPGEEGLGVRVEYRLPPRDEQPPAFGVYSGTGDSLWEALGEIERQNSARLYLDNCQAVVLMNGTEALEGKNGLLEQLNTIGSIRPKTAVLLAEGSAPMLAAEDESLSMADRILGLFRKKGGSLGGRFGLKDAVACARDSRLPLLLPVVTMEEKTPALQGFLAAEGSLRVKLTPYETMLLPLWDIWSGGQSVTLPETGAGLEMDGVYSWLTGGNASPRLTVLPRAYIRELPAGVTREAVAAELAENCHKKIEKLQNDIAAKKIPDLLLTGKIFGGATDNMPEISGLKIMVKPILHGGKSL